MAAGSTYTPISSYTLPSNAAYYDFTSIPGTYTDLVLISRAASATASTDVTFNVGNGTVDTGANYSITWLSGTGSAANSTRASGTSIGYFDNYAGTSTTLGYNVATVHFMNYSNTTTYKTVLSRSSNAVQNGTDALVNLWRSTSAINVIRVKGQTSNLLAGTNLTLYGIKAA
jgi:hypothetical protein